MKQRIITAVLGIPIILIIAWAGGSWWLALSAGMAVIGLSEFYKGMEMYGRHPLWAAGYILMVWAFLSDSTWASPTLGIASLFIAIMFMVFLFPRYHIIDVACTFFASLYVGLLMGYVWKLSFLNDHFGVILFALLLTWVSDSGAYFVGTWMGKNKMAPQLSPNKTWEGFAGGFLATVLVSLLGAILLHGMSVFHYILLGILVGLVAPVGDLFASGIKRNLEIKDFGKLIPGHGGVLDRADSFMCVAPVVYFFLSKWGG